MINVPEQTQRFFKENGVKISEDMKIFLTNSDMETVMGLPGLQLTAVERRTFNRTQVFSPQKAASFLQQFKYQMGLKYLSFSKTGVNSNGLIESENGYTEELYGELFRDKKTVYERFRDWKNVESILPGNSADLLNKPSHSLSPISEFYDKAFLENHNLTVLRDDVVEVVMIPQPGDFKDKKLSLLFSVVCKDRKYRQSIIEELGLEKRDFEILRTVGSIEKEGRFYKIEDLTTECEKGHILVLDVQNEHELASMSNCPIIKKTLDKMKEIEDNKVNCVVHLGHPDLVLKESYYKSLSRPGLKNLFCHNSFQFDFNNSELSFGELRYRYYYGCQAELLPSLFPRHPCRNFTGLQQFDLFKEQLLKPFKADDFLAMKGHDHFNLYKGEIIDIPFRSVNRRIIERIRKVTESYTKNVSISIKKWSFDDESSSVHILGTGSMNPSTFRNVSSVLLTIDNNIRLLLDCGEGTVYQLAEQFGDYFERIMASIQLVLITHIHGDHFYGLLHFIERRAELGDDLEPLIVVLPQNCLRLPLALIKHNLKSLNVILLTTTDLVSSRYSVQAKELSHWDPAVVEDGDLNYKDPDLSHIIENYKKTFPLSAQSLDELMKKHSIENIIPVPVFHCPESVGFVVDFSGKRIVYSGDCKMTMKLAEFGQKADLLIHEATFDCSHNTLDVLKKGHSNIEHALRIAKKMDAKYTCLTHFSQRYEVNPDGSEMKEIKISEKEELRDYFFKRTFLARDHLFMRMNELEKVQKLNEVINPNYIYK